MSRPAHVRIAREAAKNAHWYMCDPVEHYRCGWVLDDKYQPLGCNAGQVRAFIAEGRRRLDIAEQAYEKCPANISASSKEDIEFRLRAARDFIGHEVERIEKLFGVGAGTVQ